MQSFHVPFGQKLRGLYSLMDYLSIDETAALQHHGTLGQRHCQCVGEGEADMQCLAYLGPQRYLLRRDS